MQVVHGLSVENQENFQRQHQSEFARSHDAHHPANILALPIELLYDALDYLSTEDLVSFAFCRWDLFQALIGFLERKARPSLQGLGLLVTLFEEQWPKKWLRIIVPICARSEQPILRDLETLVGLFEDNHWRKEQLRDIIIVSARRDQPTVHSCVELGFEELACRYLRKRPHTLFDTNILHMTALHISVLKGFQNIVREIGSIAHNMREFDRVEFVNRHDDIQNTPLDYAITTPSSTIVNMLISAGARIDNTDRLGYTPLMNACHLGRDEIVHCLVDRGADIQATNNFNLSALECIMTGESRTKKTLLQRICPHATQLQLNRALWLATNDKKEFVGILLKFGADGQYAGNLEEDGSYDAERNTDPSATTPRPVEASTPLSRRHLSPSIATGVTSREDRYIIWKHRNESQAPHARRWLAPFPWNFARNVEMSDAEPDITNESTSDGTAGAQTRGMNDSSVGPQLFVDFEKLNISEGRPEKKGRHEDPQPGDIAGFGGTGKSRFFIFRVGPAQAPRHVFRRTRAYSTEGFENLSHNRISLLRYNAPNGDRHWQYTRRNIAGFRGIAIDETESNLKCPQTWINVEWKDIKEEHRYLLVDECSWTPRTDVIRLSGRKVASTGIRAIWTLQETLHIKAIQKEGKLVSPLPFPLAAFEADKIKPERSRTPAQLRSFSSTTKSRSSTSRDNMADGIKQEQEQETSTVVPSHSATQDDPGSNVVEVESSGSSQSKNQAPKKFNVQAYMASVEKMEKWNAMSEAEREKRYRIALANYDHYREERLNKGDVEVEDEL